MEKKVLQFKKEQLLLMVSGGFFITNAIVAEFMGVKIFSLEKTLGFNPLSFNLFGVDGLGLNLSAGVLLWPIVFVITDLVNEYFGRNVVKYLSWFTVALIIYSFIMIWWAIGLAPNDWWQYESGKTSVAGGTIADMDQSYKAIMGQGLWIIAGSMIAFLVGQLVDVTVFQKIKRSTGESKVWLRATGSTAVSQFIDSFVVIFIAFYLGADWDLVRVLAIGLVNYFYKLSVAILLTPLLYILHFFIDRYLGDEKSLELKEKAVLA
jgi:uncharacterized PurR-regulated membrane protein YhhQ (DUF165 family)